MLSTIRGTELEKLAVPDKSAPAAQQHTGPTWADVYASLREELAKHPSTPKHNAAAQLLRTLVEVERGKQPAASAADSVRNYVAADPDNLVSRLTAASILDEGLGRTRPAMLRFEAMGEVVEASPGATVSTLHNQEFTNVWREVLKRYIHHEDEALAAASYMDHYEIVDHHAALPMIEQRLSDLSKSLRKAGKFNEADQCSRWLARMAIGLIRTDRDSGTRLLCVDLLAQLPGAPEAARLRKDFYDQIEAAPVDLASPTKKPAVGPSSYSRAINRLITSVCLAVEGLGAAGFAILAGMASLFVRRNPVESSAMTPRMELVSRFAALLLIGLVPAFLIRGHLHGGLPSQAWALAVIPATAAFGAILSVTIANGRRGRIVPGTCALLLLLAIAAPPSFAARLYQGLGNPLVGFCLALIVIALVMAVAIVGSRAPWRRLGRLALGAWSVDVALALVFLLLHQSADRRYRAAAVAGYQDEFAARLGSDWEERYLRPIHQSYNGATTTPAKNP